MIALAVSAGSFSATQILLTTLAGGGLLGAIVALLKLRPDANTAAVTQSQSAVETMATLNKQLEEERNDWRTRALTCETAAREAQAKLDAAQAELDRLKAAQAKRRSTP